jgi:hypothetical protein
MKPGVKFQLIGEFPVQKPNHALQPTAPLRYAFDVVLAKFDFISCQLRPPEPWLTLGR